MRTEGFRRDLICILLIFALALSISFISTSVLADAVYKWPGNGYPNIYDVAQGQTFLLRHRMGWDEPGVPGYYIVSIYWDYDADNAKHFTLESVVAYFDNDEDNLPDPGVALIDNTVSTKDNGTRYAIAISNAIGNENDGIFNVDITLRASGPDDSPHAITDNHPIYYTIMQSLESFPPSIAVPGPVTVRVLGLGLDVAVAISPSYQSGPPGTTLSYSVTVTNTGTSDDTYDLTISDNESWELSVSENLFESVAPGENRTATLSVTVPENAVSCTRDNVAVTVTSRTENTVENSVSCIAHAIVPGIQLWDALITATFSGGRDDAIFGVRPDATAGFDSAYDIPEPPPPVDPPYVQAFFHYPGNDPLPTKLHKSCIPPGDIMEWPFRVSHHNGTDNITLSWNLENVPADYAVILFEGENLVADMRVVDNYTFQTSSDFDFTIHVEVTVAWRLIETWAGNVSTPAEWQLIKTWTGAVEAPIAWHLVETWIGTTQTPVPLATPSLISPVDGTVTGDNTPTFDWSDVAGAENYDLLVDDDADFSSPEIHVIVSVSTYTPTVELPEDNYSWKVRARDAANNVSDWSSIWALHIISVARGVEVSISPPYQSGLPGTTLNYVVTVTNTGNVEDNYLLSIVDDATWNPSIFPTSLTVPTGENRGAALAVTVPENAAICTEDNITVFATSEVDNTVSAEDSCIAHAKPEEGIRIVIYPAIDVFAFSKNGARYSRSQLKFDIREIPFGSNILSAKLWLYRLAADNWDGNILLNRVDDQLWDENITAVEFDAQTLTNEETRTNKFISHGWGYLDVKNQLDADHEAGNSYSSYRLRWANDNGDEPSAGIDDGRFLVIESELGELFIILYSSEYNGSDPYLEVFYLPILVYPEKPTLYSPPNGSTISDNTPYFEWTKGNNAGYHRLLVDNDPSFSSPEENRILHDNYYTIAGENSLPDDNYSWKVIAINALGENQSSVWTFVIDTVPPAAPSLISPINGTITNDNTPTFDWSDVAGAENYDLLVDNDAGFSSPEIQVTVSVSTHTPTAELPDNNYSWKVRARDAANNVGDWSSTWTLIISVARGVDVYISPSYQSGLPEATLSYTVTVTNTGAFDDNYDLTPSDDAGWGPSLDNSLFENVQPGENRTATLSVTIPENAAPSTEDNIKVTVTSQADNTVSDFDTCVAHAKEVRREVEVSISPSYQSAPAGTTLSYQVIVRNTGNITDNYDLTVSDDFNWGLSLFENRFENVAENQEKTATLDVTIPETAVPCTEDNIIVDAISREYPDVKDNAACIAHVLVCGVDVTLEPKHQRGTPGTELTFLVMVHNTGDIEDNYYLLVEEDGWPMENIWLEDEQLENIKPCENRVTKLHVRIPEDAEPCTHKEIVVVAESEFCDATDNDNALVQVVSAYLHAEGPIYLNEPVCTWWHELYPNFSKRYHLTSWEDNNGDDKLSPSDQIDMMDNETGELDNYHVKDVTVTLFISKKPDRVENMYVEFDGDFENWDNLKKDPECTQWHEIWPVFSKRYHLMSWEDENWNGVLGPSDQIFMVDKETGENYWYHVDEVAIDIVLCKKPPVVPSAPILKSPADGTITNDNTPTFEWTVGLNADNHRLLVDDDPGFTSPIENRLFGFTENTYTPALDNSLPDDNYSWKVIAIRALAENQSFVWTFVIDTVSPAAPSLISPANGTITDDNTPTFDWSDVTGAENYDLLVDDDANFSSPEIQVTVSASTYTPTAELPDGTYSWKVRARDAANNVGDWSSTWTLIISVTRGVDVYISPSYQSGLPGATLSYSVTVKNEGNISDTFDLTATDSAGWVPTLSKDSLAIPPKAYDTVTLAVTIPTDASVGDQDNITITAESTVDPTVSDSARCTAQATAIRRMVEVSISPRSKSGPPGEKLTYKVTVLNEGDVEDTYDLTVLDDLTWGSTVSPTSLTIAAGSSGTATVSVTIPDGTAGGTEDEITVTATSRVNLAVSDSATCIASAAAVRAVIVSISPENQSGTPKEMLTYTVTVKNEGNVGDTYILSVAGAPDWSPRVENTSLTLNAGEAGETTLTVTIPPGASEGALITVNATAISVGDPRVVGSDTCRAIVKGVPVVPEELLIPLAISAFLIIAAILTAAYLLHVRPKKAARRRVLKGPRRIMLRGPRRTR